jgi:hypothetical protein
LGHQVSKLRFANGKLSLPDVRSQAGAWERVDAMKQTTFEFELRGSPDSQSNARELLTEALKEIDGIDDVLLEEESATIIVKISVSFASSDIAKKLHRKITNRLLGLKNIAIVHVRSILTEVFD